MPLVELLPACGDLMEASTAPMEEGRKDQVEKELAKPSDNDGESSLENQLDHLQILLKQAETEMGTTTKSKTTSDPPTSKPSSEGSPSALDQLKSLLNEGLASKSSANPKDPIAKASSNVADIDRILDEPDSILELTSIENIFDVLEQKSPRKKNSKPAWDESPSGVKEAQQTSATEEKSALDELFGSDDVLNLFEDKITSVNQKAEAAVWSISVDEKKEEEQEMQNNAAAVAPSGSECTTPRGAPAPTTPSNRDDSSNEDQESQNSSPRKEEFKESTVVEGSTEEEPKVVAEPAKAEDAEAAMEETTAADNEETINLKPGRLADIAEGEETTEAEDATTMEEDLSGNNVEQTKQEAKVEEEKLLMPEEEENKTRKQHPTDGALEGVEEEKKEDNSISAGCSSVAGCNSVEVVIPGKDDKTLSPAKFEDRGIIAAASDTFLFQPGKLLKHEVQKLRADYHKVEESNKRLSHVNSSAGASFESLNQLAQQLRMKLEESKADVAEANAALAESKTLVAELIDDLEIKQTAYVAEVQARLRCQKAVQEITELVQTTCKDPVLVQKIATLADKVDEDAMAVPVMKTTDESNSESNSMTESTSGTDETPMVDNKTTTKPENPASGGFLSFVYAKTCVWTT